MKALFIIGFVALGWYLKGEKVRILETASQVASEQVNSVKQVIKQEYRATKPKVEKVVKQVTKKAKATYVTQKVLVNNVAYNCTEFKSSSVQFKRCDKINN